jgi:hypothetical protein
MLLREQPGPPCRLVPNATDRPDYLYLKPDAYANAFRPVISRPTMRVCTVSVPS